MKKYAFILGNNEALSLAEIVSVLKREKIDFLNTSYSKEVFLIEARQLPESLVDTLGGTIKIIEIFDVVPVKEFIPELIIDALKRKIVESEKGEKNKTRIGFSVYNLKGSKKMVHRLARSFKYLSINLKKVLKEDNINLAFINIKHDALPSATVIKNKLVGSNGFEFDLVVDGHEIYLGNTIQVQNIDLYTILDVGRPKRDLLSGTTPPKLAKLMVNLAGKEKNSILLDPFCGSGTYLQEMALLGYETIYGTDISEKAILDTKENTEWLKERFLKNEANIQIELLDALELSEKFKEESVDAIVSEVYLGPPMKNFYIEKEVAKTIDELTNLYSKVLTEMNKILVRDGRIVLALPVFASKESYRLLPLNNVLEELGLQVVNYLKEFKEVSKDLITERNTLLYSRKDQFVYREIVILRKN